MTQSDRRAQNYPWFADVANRVASSWQQARLPHGLLLCAPEGSGKLGYGLHLAKSILCVNNSANVVGVEKSHSGPKGLESQVNPLQACGHCKACQLFDSGAHPDFHLLERLEEKGKRKKNIAVDQVREMIEKLTIKPHLNGWRVVVVEAVDYLNANGFNAMLKTLEEPGENTLLMLCSHNLSAVPATIRSRCQILTVYPTQQDTVDWLSTQVEESETSIKRALDLACGGPLEALRLLTSGEIAHINDLLAGLDALWRGEMSPFEVLAQAMQLDGAYQVLASYWFELMKANTMKSSDFLSNRPGVPQRRLSRLYDKVIELNRISATGGNLNHGLQLETLLVEWYEIGKKYSKSLA